MNKKDAQSVVQLMADTTVLVKVLEELEAGLAEAPLEIRRLALDFIDGTPELIRVEQSAASWTGVACLLEPSQRLVDFAAAVRAGDFERLRIEYSH